MQRDVGPGGGEATVDVDDFARIGVLERNAKRSKPRSVHQLAVVSADDQRFELVAG